MSIPKVNKRPLTVCGRAVAARRGGALEAVAPLSLLFATAAAPAWAAPDPAVAPPAARAQAGAQTPVKAPAAVPAADQGGAEAPDETETAVEGVDVVLHKDYAHQVGAVVGTLPPEVQFTPAQIQSFGVNTVGDLIGELSPEVHSDRGRGPGAPVVLLNGRRISGLSEVLSLPTEAILRVDVMPEEASLAYGYPADQRVLNIVLRRHFRATLGGVEGGESGEGARAVGQAQINLLRVHRDTRLNLEIKYKDASDITEAARGISVMPGRTPYDLTGNVTGLRRGGEIDPALSALVGQPVTIAGVPADVAAGATPTLADFAGTAGAPNVTHIADYRSLAPRTQSLSANAVIARPLEGGWNATFNAAFTATATTASRGLPGVRLIVPAGDPYSPFATDVRLARYLDQPRHQYVDGWAGHLGATFNKDVRRWRLSAIGTFDHADTQTDMDSRADASTLQVLLYTLAPRVNPFGPLDKLVTILPQNHARVISDTAEVSLLATGPLMRLPAGDLMVSAKAGDVQTWFDATASLIPGYTIFPGFPSVGGVQDTSRRRNDGSGQISVDLPIASRKNGVLAPLGELSLNANGRVDQLSDFGTLAGFGYGASWSPRGGVNLLASYTSDRQAPSLPQLADPTIVMRSVQTFDYNTGQTSFATHIVGGNPLLRPDTRNVLKLSLTLRPWPTEDLALNATYLHSSIRDAITTLPAASPDIQAAFPWRFQRGPTGALILERDRPINFARWEREEVRWGLTYSRRLGAAGPGSGLSAARLPGDERAKRGPFKGLSGAASGGRLQLAVYHTIYLSDRELLRPGRPLVDLLGGGAASFFGGQPRNEVEAQLGLSWHGKGVRASADWREGTTVLGAPGLPAATLRFSDVTTINLRLYDNFAQQRDLVARHPWLRGTRISLNVTNLLDQHVNVRDLTGVTPSAFQAGYMDPYGRTISLSIRKLFF